ncbi:U-Kazal-Dg21.2-like [Sitodiplosis mosellana]|uniref:U-Kazal-Dg21.2-like n=1 Tax=Sitodiplosis mosellana TaxID=263140 RepID=UPI0024447B08|nr:U-Kazal-Dg21.2-like [Sitodiplosis mosellana]
MKVLLIAVVVVIGAAVVIIDCATLPSKTHQRTGDYDEHTCPRRCSEAYYPLCGINQAGDTKVFVNDCYMSMENCNQLAQQVYHPTDESDCPDFDEWISEDSIRQKLNI